VKKAGDPVFVTRPFLPPLEEFVPYLEKIWGSHILTNNGPFQCELEQKLCDYLGVKYISLFSNGTLALIAALQVLKISGEVITTPFSFVATTHALLWNNVKPVFVDIDPDTCNLDPDKIEAAITPMTSAILPVHVFGNPCNFDRIQQIAMNHGLKVIYDAAHAFGVRLKGTSVANYGDLSVLSFHAIKVFNTFEGGAVICHDAGTKEKIDSFKNFGITGDATVETWGINGKMNEFQAALGLLQLKHIDELIAKRKLIEKNYREGLKDVPGVLFQPERAEVKFNYAYLPVLIDSEEFGRTRDDVFEELKKHNIYGRRYFYPLISQLLMYSSLESSQPGKMPVAERVTEQVLCLPIYPDLDISIVKGICKIISDLGRNK
jgi:dTDP-4-amino-4,6-dideoxygalactose transaminase